MNAQETIGLIIGVVLVIWMVLHTIDFVKGIKGDKLSIEPIEEAEGLNETQLINESRKLVVNRHDISCSQMKQLVDGHGHIKDTELDSYVVWSHVRKDLLRLMSRANGYVGNEDIKKAHDKLFGDDK